MPSGDDTKRITDKTSTHDPPSYAMTSVPRQGKPLRDNEQGFEF